MKDIFITFLVGRDYQFQINKIGFIQKPQIKQLDILKKCKKYLKKMVLL